MAETQRRMSSKDVGNVTVSYLNPQQDHGVLDAQGANPKINLDDFAAQLDTAMRQQNVYYDDLIVGNVLRTLVITKVPKNGFQEYMKSKGKLGGQNKLPRLSNDRAIAEFFEKIE